MPGLTYRMILDHNHKDYIDPSYLPLALKDTSELQDLSALTIMDDPIVTGNHRTSGRKTSKWKSGVVSFSPSAHLNGSDGSMELNSMSTKRLSNVSNESKKVRKNLQQHTGWADKNDYSPGCVEYNSDSHDLGSMTNGGPRLVYQHEASMQRSFASTDVYTSGSFFGEAHECSNSQWVWPHSDPTCQLHGNSAYDGRATSTSFPIENSPADEYGAAETVTAPFEAVGAQWQQSPSVINHSPYSTVEHLDVPITNTLITNVGSHTFSVQALHFDHYPLNSRLLKDDEDSGSTADAPELIPSSDTSPSMSEDSQDNGSPPDLNSSLDDTSYYKKPLTGDDGKFLCPFAEEQDCGHPPTKHRCAYEKYLDSHYKPHRCKVRGCEELRFSSSACLVRHEREAHGSHGHGVRPFLCLYEDCERSKEGNGFPRSWNRNDHMKRVHDHQENFNAQTEIISDEKDVKETRKRPKRGSNNNDCSRAKRHKPENESQVQTNEKLRKLFDSWVILHSDIHDTWHTMRGPLDLDSVQKLYDQSAELLSSAHKIWAGVDHSEEE